MRLTGGVRDGGADEAAWGGVTAVRPLAWERQDLGRRLVAWSGLGAPIPLGVAATVGRLGAVQLDPMQVVAPAHLWTLSLRRGPTTAGALDRALGRGELVEAICGVRALVHVEDAAALVGGWRRRRARNLAAVYAVDDAARRVMALAESGEPFTARSLEGGERVTGFWEPVGVRTTKATSVAVDLLWAEGRLAVVGRRGGQKLYRLMESHLPRVAALVADLSVEEAAALAVRHSLRTWGVLWTAQPLGWGACEGATGRREWLERAGEEGWAVPLTLAGAGRSGGGPRPWAAAALLEGDTPRAARAALLAPLDNVLWNRDRLETLFAFRYRWEAYVPAAKRRASAYNMPVLTGARFWGEADARWREGRFEAALRGADGQAVPLAVESAVARAARLAERLRGRP